MSRLIDRLKESKLGRWVLAYVAGAWLLLEVFGFVADRFGWPAVLVRSLTVLLGVGFFVTLVLAWYHGEKGRQRVSGPELVMIAALLAVAGTAVVFVREGGDSEADARSATAENRGGFRDREVDPRSIAVLPFANRDAGGGEEAGFFADGMHDDILTQLSKVGSLMVISRSSVMQYRDTEKSMPQIAEELYVATVLEGGVQRAGDRVRINLQLIDAESDVHLWAETYDRELTVENIFAIQSDVAQQVAVALEATLTPLERERIGETPTENVEAYEWFLRANHYYYDREEYRIAAQLYENAIELDAEFALAYAMLSMVETELYFVIFEERTEERLARAKRAADRALELDPDLPEAHMAMGLYHYWGERQYDRALEHLTVAQRGLAHDVDGYWPIAAVQRRQGKFEEAAANFNKAFELSPRLFGISRELGNTYYLMRRYAEAATFLDRAISLAPDQFGLYLWRATLYVGGDGNPGKAQEVLREAWTRMQPPPLYRGNDPWQWWLYRIIDRDYERTLSRLASGSVETDTASYFLTKAELYRLVGESSLAHAYSDSARVLLEGELEARPGNPSSHSRLGVAYAGLGRKRAAIREAKRAEELFPISTDAIDGMVGIAFLAEVYSMVGEYDAAVDELEHLLSVPTFITSAWLRVDPIWDPLREHQRFQALLQRYE